MSDKLPPKILVIEPDKTLRANICNTIERYWFEVVRASDSDSALRVAEVDPPNIVIISTRKQDKTAIEIATMFAAIKSLKDIPVLFVIEEGEDEQRYLSNMESNNIIAEVVTRPFTPSDLMTSIRSILKKSKPIFQDRVISYNDITMDLCSFKIHRGDKRIHLGPMEFKILQLFVQNPKTTYSRRQIIDYAWGIDKDISHRTIDVHINRIRTAIKRSSDRYAIIKTIRAAGYCLD